MSPILFALFLTSRTGAYASDPYQAVIRSGVDPDTWYARHKVELVTGLRAALGKWEQPAPGAAAAALYFTLGLAPRVLRRGL